jgi:hypothetical protein
MNMPITLNSPVGPVTISDAFLFVGIDETGHEARAYSDEATGTLTASLSGAALGARLLRGVSRLNCRILYKSAL